MDDDPQTLNAFETRVDEVLQRSISSFRRIFISTVLIGLGIFCVIVLPYVSSHTARSELLRQANALEHQIKSSDDLIRYHGDLIERVDNAMRFADGMREKFIDFSYHQDLQVPASQQRVRVARFKRVLEDEPDAAAWIDGDAPRPLLSDEFYHTHPSYKKPWKDPCFWLDVDLWTNCRISQDLTSQHNALRQELGKTDPKLSAGIEFHGLKEKLDEIMAPFDRWAEDPDPGGKAKTDNVRGLLSRSLNTYREAIADARRVLQESQDDAVERLARTETELGQTLDKVKRAEARLAQARKFETIETPIGDLPVGLDDLVLLFPVALTVVMLYLFNQLEQAIALRLTLHRCLSRRSVDLPGGAAQYLRMTSALWLEPIDPRPRRAVQLSLLAVPALAALFAIYLVMDSDFLFSDTVVPETTTRVAFVTGYLASNGFLAFAVGRLFAIAKTYRVEYESSSPIHDGHIDFE